MGDEKHYDSYIICTSPRSGSTLLCRLLSATGHSGKPDSHFHHPSISEWCSRYRIESNEFSDNRELLKEVFNAARIRGTGGTGIFGLRLQRHSVDYFLEQLRGLSATDSVKSDVDYIQGYFGKTLFIHLTRQNKLEQAISYVIATQSGLWHKAPDGTEIERLSPARELVYDANEIARWLRDLSEMEEQWKSWFAQQQLKPLSIKYSDLSADPNGTIATILERLGVNRRHAEGIELPVAKLADDTNRLWAARFKSEWPD